MRLFTVTVEGQQPDVVEAMESAEAVCRALASTGVEEEVSIDVAPVSRLSQPVETFYHCRFEEGEFHYSRSLPTRFS